MELTEPIESINRQLVDLFGKDTITGLPIWRVVWSEDQYEKQLLDVSPNGIQLLTPQVFEIPKYRQWIKEKFVLEQLVLVPEGDQKQLLGAKISYEPMYPFEDNQGNPLPPRVDFCKFIIDSVYAAMGKKSMAKYKDDIQKDPIGATNARIERLYQDLYGNETETNTSMAVGEAIVVPQSYGDEK